MLSISCAIAEVARIEFTPFEVFRSVRYQSQDRFMRFPVSDPISNREIAGIVQITGIALTLGDPL